MNKPIKITVGGGGYNPVADTTDYNNPDLAGVDGYVDMSGYGIWGADNYQLLPSGGFRLLNGVTFTQDEVFHFVPTGIVYNAGASNFTNGFDYSLVMQALFSRIGFRQPTKTGYNNLVDTSNLTATSNRYFDDFHSAATASNFKDCQDDPAIGNVNFNARLDSFKRSVIMRCLTAIFGAPEYIEQVLLFDKNIAAREEPVLNSGLFVGYAINVAQTFDRAVQVNGATLLFDTDCNVTLYLFKDGKKSPIWNQTVSAIANEATLVTFSDLVMTYIGAATKGSRFYLGYFQDQLTGQGAKAINENTVSWAETKCFGAVPFFSPKTATTDFNRNQVSYNRMTYGLNLEMSSFKNWTQIIVKRPNIFDEAIGLTGVFVIVEQMIYAMRSNQNERFIKDGLTLASLVQDLNGSAPISDGPKPVVGLDTRIAAEIKRVKESILPCPKAQIVSLC